MNNFPTIWMDAICTGNPEQVLRLYTPDAVLLATYDKNVLRGHRQLLPYFRRFMSKPGLCGEIQSTYVQNLGRAKVISGLYKFQFTKPNGNPIDSVPQTVNARYTFVLVPTRAGWKVAEHHSSEVPK